MLRKLEAGFSAAHYLCLNSNSLETRSQAYWLKLKNRSLELLQLPELGKKPSSFSKLPQNLTRAPFAVRERSVDDNLN